MISIIICSRTKSIPDSLLDNLKKTIGIEYELIIIDNSEHKYSIFEAYNIGIAKSKKNIICFLHDDIHFVTRDWGGILIEIFNKNPNIGLIGVAGAKSKTKMPSAWWNCPEEDKCMNILQYFKNGKKEHWCKGFEYSDLEDVVAIDGVFMAAKKENTISFNRELKGFHNYDLNFSFEYLKNGYRVVVTKNILLEHFSIGNLNEDWYTSTLQIHKFYRDFLPLNKSSFVSLKNYEFSNGTNFIEKLLKYKKKREGFNLWKKVFLINPISKFHFTFFRSFFK
ncbi:glycosyltransferase [Flavobacterium luteolum]|uniref:glycosyltransferase n=1 Tax=Flavobacterium luteolum TaxID=3003259 RepID=UPI00248E0EA2|nr:glycosyltransferase [Flavobacterium luteolum]